MVSPLFQGEGRTLSALTVAFFWLAATASANSPPTDSRWHLLEPGGGPAIQTLIRTGSNPGGDEILALTGTELAFTTTNSGSSWQAFELGGLVPTHGLVVDPHRPVRLLALYRPASLLEGGTDSLVESIDGGITWKLQGQFEVRVDNLTFDQRLANTVFVSNGANVLRSTDAGDTFQVISSLPDSVEQFLSIDPGRPILLARTASPSRLFVSADNGITWTETFPGVQILQISAATGTQAIYAAGFTTADGPDNLHLLESLDSGDSWSALLELSGELIPATFTVSPDARTLAFASQKVETGVSRLHLNRVHLPTLAREDFVLPKDIATPQSLLATDEGVLLMASSAGSILRLSADGLLSRQLTRGFPTPRQRIAAFQDERRTLTSGHEFSDDAGVTWQSSSNFQPSKEEFRFLRTDESRAWALDSGHLLVSEDVGRSWTQILLPPGDVTFFPALAIATSDQAILAGTSGLYTLDSGERNWILAQAAPPWEEPVSLAILDGVGQRLLVLSEFEFPSTGGTGRSFHLSEDGGQTWREVINDFAVNGYLLHAVPEGPVFLQSSSGVFRSEDGSVFDPRPVVPTSRSGQIYSFAVDPSNDERFALSALRGIFLSFDTGKSWSATLTAPTRLLPSLEFFGFPTVDLAFDRFGRLYAATQFGLMAIDPPSTLECTETQNVACLLDRRFRVDINTVDPTLVSRAGIRLEITADTTAFSIFDEDNLEIVLKVVDGCAINGHFWIFAAGLTDVGVEVVVSDTLGDGIYRFRNPLGRAFPPVQDVEAFECAPPA